MRSLQNELNRFVQNSRHHTLLIKGKWGIGKTLAVRQFLLNECSPVKTVSYVSLSGVASVSDERSLAISGLEREAGRPLWERLPRKFSLLGKPAINLIPHV